VTWVFVVFAAALLGYAVVSRRLSGSIVTAPMVFLAAGIASGVAIVDLQLAPGAAGLELLAEATLTVVLFSDASRIDLARLRLGRALPVRLLGIGLPLTIVLGALLALVVAPGFLVLEAAIVAICLAPTDAALGQAVVSDERIPVRIRQGLNVESGLNDGICVPLLVIALALASSEAGEVTVGDALRIVVEQIGWGVAAGVGAGALGAILVRSAIGSGSTGKAGARLAATGTALLAYGLAVALGGSAFIAAFVAGLLYGILLRAAAHDPDESTGFVEDLGALLGAATFLIFGAAVVVPYMGQVGPSHLILAILFLTVVRMAPVALAMVGSGAGPVTIGFVGWFGPRGLASIVFAIIVLHDGAELPMARDIILTIALTVLISIVAHGLTAGPLARRYATWFDATRSGRPGLMEGADVPDQRPRSQM